MLVEEWMTKNVVTIKPETSVMKASTLMKEHKVRRLPVVDEQEKLVGIVSDRDIKSASPSKATTLDVHEMYYLLSEMKCKDIMTRNPIFAKGKDSIEEVAAIMSEKNFGGVPVVDEEQKICGIITDNDIFKTFIVATGVKCGGIQLAFDLPDTHSSLKNIFDTLHELGVAVVSVLTHSENSLQQEHRVYIRLEPLAEDKEKLVIETVEKSLPLIYWEANKACKHSI